MYISNKIPGNQQIFTGRFGISIDAVNEVQIVPHFVRTDEHAHADTRRLRELADVIDAGLAKRRGQLS